MNKIIQKQNEPVSIGRLKAQRKIYRQAKYIAYASLLLFVIPIVVGNIVKVWLGSNVNFINAFAAYGAIAAVLKLSFSIWESAKKKSAASVQQLFDTYLYDIPWKKIWGKKPSQEFVNQVSRNEPDSKLMDWYEPLIEKADHNVGVLLCQLENMRYDEQLKTMFYRNINVLFYAYIAIVLVFEYFYYHESVFAYMLHTLLPISPIVVWYGLLMRSRKKELELRGRLDALTDAAWNIVKSYNSVSMSRLEEIQDALYAYRCEVNAVPDAYYNWHRDMLEGIAYQSSKDRLFELGIINQEEYAIHAE